MEKVKPNLEATGSSTRTMASLEDALRMVESSEVIGLDLETTGLDPYEAALRLVQVSNGSETYVIDAWTNVEVGKLFEALAPKTVVAHNAKFEWSWVYHRYRITL